MKHSKRKKTRPMCNSRPKEMATDSAVLTRPLLFTSPWTYGVLEKNLLLQNEALTNSSQADNFPEGTQLAVPLHLVAFPFFLPVLVADEELSAVLDTGDWPPINEDDSAKPVWWRHLGAGASAGSVSRTVTAPLDRLKILLQVHGSSEGLTIRSGLKHMVQEGGWSSLWRGNGVNVLKNAPEQALRFMFYEQIKGVFKGDDRSRVLTLPERFVSGSLAGSLAQTAIYPMEVLKTRLALRKTGQYSGIVDCASQMIKREGARSLFRGYLPNICGIIPYAGIDLTLYETLRFSYRQSHNDASPPVVLTLAFGALSSSAGMSVSYPLALVRTRLQAQGSLAGAEHRSRESFPNMLRSIVKTDGVKGLYRGLVPNLLKVIPAVSLNYVVYEKAKQHLGIESI